MVFTPGGRVATVSPVASLGCTSPGVFFSTTTDGGEEGDNRSLLSNYDEDSSTAAVTETAETTDHNQGSRGTSQDTSPPDTVASSEVSSMQPCSDTISKLKPKAGGIVPPSVVAKPRPMAAGRSSRFGVPYARPPGPIAGGYPPVNYRFGQVAVTYSPPVASRNLSAPDKNRDSQYIVPTTEIARPKVNKKFLRKPRPADSHHEQNSSDDLHAPKTASSTRMPSHKPREVRIVRTWGDHFAVDRRSHVTRSPWIVVSNIPANSSLEAMLQTIQKAVDEDLKRGVVDLDALYIPNTRTPKFKTRQDEIDRRQERFPHIFEARLILSPYGRPNGWYVRLAHRSLAQALLIRNQRGEEFHVGSKLLRINEYKLPDPPKEPPFLGSHPNISDATLRVENCPNNLRETALYNYFSRFELSMEQKSVVEWDNVTPDGKGGPTSTFLVHFANASWARAALRERQGAPIGNTPVRLVQYPRQLIADEVVSQYSRW